jgi:CHRD domain
MFGSSTIIWSLVKLNGKIVLYAISLLALASGMIASPTFAVPPANRNFSAHLSGETWTSKISGATYTIDTLAQGQAIFEVSKDGQSIDFVLIAANIENITMAHIHVDDGAIVGPIVVWLYPRTPPLQLIPGRFDGILAKGTITASDLVGIMAGMTINDLVNKMNEGLTYVVIHTSQHPPGEIRAFIS